MSEKILQQGAEALIIHKGKDIIKRRIKKSYRLPEIDDNIRRLRTRSEAKLLEKAGKIISIPNVIKVDEKTKEIVMGFIQGKKLSEHLDSFPLEKQKEIFRAIGKNVAKIHDADIIHGDLTTSNMIYVSDKHKKDVNDKKRSDTGYSIKNKLDLDERKRGDKNFRVFFIDFGLGFHSHKVEDKAVDLHLLKEALEAKHFMYWHALFSEFLKGYESSKNSKQVIEQMKKVESRGRYKDRY